MYTHECLHGLSCQCVLGLNHTHKLKWNNVSATGASIEKLLVLESYRAIMILEGKRDHLLEKQHMESFKIPKTFHWIRLFPLQHSSVNITEVSVSVQYWFTVATQR